MEPVEQFKYLVAYTYTFNNKLGLSVQIESERQLGTSILEGPENISVAQVDLWEDLIDQGYITNSAVFSWSLLTE